MSAPDTPKDGVLYHTGYPVSAQRDSRVASVLRREENSPWGPFERPVVSSRYRLYPKLRSRNINLVPFRSKGRLFNDRADLPLYGVNLDLRTD
jgi:hypothetical protein